MRRATERVRVGEAFNGNEAICLCASGSVVMHSDLVGLVSFHYMLYFVNATYKFTPLLMFSGMLSDIEIIVCKGTAVPEHMNPFLLYCAET